MKPFLALVSLICLTLVAQAADETTATPWGSIAWQKQQAEITVTTLPENRKLKIPALRAPLESLLWSHDGRQHAVSLSPELDSWLITLPGDFKAGEKLILKTTAPIDHGTEPQVIVGHTESNEAEKWWTETILLPAHAATIPSSKLLRYEPQIYKNTVGYWANETDTCQWQFHSPASRTYRVFLLQGCGKGQGGSEVAVEVDGQRLTFTTQETGHFQHFRRLDLGTITIKDEGTKTLKIIPLKKAHGAVMDVREVQLLAASSPERLSLPSSGDRFLTNSIGVQLAKVPAGEFLMGSPESEEERSDDEDQHPVKISKDFFLGQHEITYGQFRKFVESTGYVTSQIRKGLPGFGYDEKAKAMEELPQFNWQNTGWVQQDNHPVVNVSWEDAVAFCDWLSKVEGKKYRLPTDAEWEYACRAGTKTRYYTGEAEETLRPATNLADLSFNRMYPNATWNVDWDDKHPFAAPVGSFQPNAWGMYDMHGNVWEWCQDWYAPIVIDKANPPAVAVDPAGPAQGELRVLRGGAFTNRLRFVRSADRNRLRPKYRANFTGFRIVLEQ